MWAALRYEAETNTADGEGNLRSNMLLLDEPELCLHPSAIREACSVLYDLPQTGRWQVMVTTHSPAFIDLSRNNTTVVRVERDVENDVIKGTTVFRPQKANLSADDKEELKMLNLCDPHVFEFFFGGRTVLVEGDTEYTAFKYVMSKLKDDAKLRDIHIVRARGKSILRLLAGILNQFNASYAVLHDSDAPTILKKQKNAAQPVETVNPAWTNNVRILEAVAQAVAEGRVRLVALVPNFEHALLGKEAADDKPYNAWSALRDNEALCQKVRELLYGLTSFTDALPEECIDWQQEEVLRQKWTDWNSANNP